MKNQIDKIQCGKCKGLFWILSWTGFHIKRYGGICPNCYVYSK